MGAAQNLKSNPLLDKSIANAFVEGVVKTLDAIASTKVTLEKPFVEKKLQSKGEVAGLIGMVSGDMKGTITVSFTKSAVFQILENMFGETHTELNEEVADAVGEFTNMIYGTAKTTLNERGYDFQMAIPTVIMGSMKITNFHSGATLVIPFSIEEDKRFYVEITVQA